MDISASVAGSTQRVFELENRDTIRQYLDTYFDKSDIADCVFLHRATTIAEWSQGKLEKTLLKAICASALRLAPTYHSEASPAHNWIKQVQHDLVNHMGDMSVPKLQALMLVIKFLFSMRFTGDVWVLLSIASRVAFTKRLNYERPAIDPVKQECLRRLMWSIYSVDKIFCGGIEDLTVILSGTSPYLSRGQLRSLDLELTSFEESLPDELQLTDNRLMIMCHSEEARTYTTLHTILFSSRCDLHRFLISGIREAVSPEAVGQTPREYIDYCQQQCLQTALKYIDMWSKVRQMETSSRVGTPTFAVVTYQFVKMVDHLATLLPLHGESSLPVIKQKFMDILLIVSGSRAEVGWVGSCITDIENLIPRLGTRHISPGSPSASPGTLRLQEKLHRRSKHAFAPDDEEEEDPAIRPPESNTGEEIPETTLESAVLGNPTGQDIWSFPVQGDEHGLTGSTGDGSLGSFSSMGYPLINYDSINSTDMVFGDQELGFPLDPFDLQMNAYTDANAPQY
ncbi:NirA-like nitrate assimilation regulatory protein [Fusarium sp. NRRL 25303]|nr:NirA-like nitrate assimilation regulatory protein [Fusarium sp. NRRL 25303]